MRNKPVYHLYRRVLGRSEHHRWIPSWVERNREREREREKEMRWILDAFGCCLVYIVWVTFGLQNQFSPHSPSILSIFYIYLSILYKHEENSMLFPKLKSFFSLFALHLLSLGYWSRFFFSLFFFFFFFVSFSFSLLLLYYCLWLWPLDVNNELLYFFALV